MASVFDYVFNIGGNYSATINGMTAATGDFTAEVRRSQKWTEKLTGALARFDYLNNVVQNVANGIETLSGSCIRLDSQMHDLSAVAGVAGDSLKQIETFARQNSHQSAWHWHNAAWRPRQQTSALRKPTPQSKMRA